MFISCQKHTLYFHSSSSIHSSKNPKLTIIINCHNPNEQQQQQQHKNHPIPRTQNSKSTSFLIQHLSQKNNNTNPSPTELQDSTTHEENIKLLELSLVRKRTPQFPGSIYAQSPSDPDVGSSLPPLRTLFRSGDQEEEEMIMQALEIRMKVTEEVFKDAMRKGKFGITYSTNLVDRLGGFIDYVMIEVLI
ncbi:Mitochondrial transcription termination factor family protein [Trifolium repens]|nr:Mitochondrial transcription termination factor family protein [Trifolium repens]